MVYHYLHQLHSGVKDESNDKYLPRIYRFKKIQFSFKSLNYILSIASFSQIVFT